MLARQQWTKPSSTEDRWLFGVVIGTKAKLLEVFRDPLPAALGVRTFLPDSSLL